MPKKKDTLDRDRLLDLVTVIVPFRPTYWVYGLGADAETLEKPSTTLKGNEPKS